MKTVKGFKAIVEALRDGKKLRRSFWDNGEFVELKEDSFIDENGEYADITCNFEYEIIEDEPELFYIWYVKRGFVSDYYFNKEKKAFDDELADYLHKIAYAYPAIDKDFNEYKYNFETKKWERLG